MPDPEAKRLSNDLTIALSAIDAAQKCLEGEPEHVERERETPTYSYSVAFISSGSFSENKGLKRDTDSHCTKAYAESSQFRPLLAGGTGSRTGVGVDAVRRARAMQGRAWRVGNHGYERAGFSGFPGTRELPNRATISGKTRSNFQNRSTNFKNKGLTHRSLGERPVSFRRFQGASSRERRGVAYWRTMRPRSI